ncbi:hypothetical protein B4916_21570 [Yersinia intermedia]|nr:hypothetical protein B4916_21570 [Yersinia intermedia]
MGLSVIDCFSLKNPCFYIFNSAKAANAFILAALAVTLLSEAVFNRGHRGLSCGFRRLNGDKRDAFQCSYFVSFI